MLELQTCALGGGLALCMKTAIVHAHFLAHVEIDDVGVGLNSGPGARCCSGRIVPTPDLNMMHLAPLLHILAHPCTLCGAKPWQNLA